MTETTSKKPPAPGSALRAYEQEKREAYSKVAPVYDDHRFANPAGRLLCDETNAFLSELLEPGRGIRVLDVGAGTGRTSIYLAEQGAQVSAYDITPQMLDIARHRAEERGLTNISFHIGAARELPFQDGVFDAAICIRTLHLIPREEHEEHIQEMWRVVRPGGKLVYELPNRAYGLVLRAYQSLHRRLRLKRDPCSSFWPAEAARSAQQLGGTCRLVGLMLPGSALLSRLSRPLAFRVNRLGLHFPCNRLADLLWVVVSKGESASG